MDISKLTHGAKMVLGGTIAFLIVSLFSWFSINGQGFANMWHGIGFIAGLLAIALLVWEGVHLAGMKVGVPLHPAMAGAVLAILVAIFTFIRFISTPGGDLGAAVGVGRTFWAWLGLALAIAIAIGAFVNMKEIGLTMADMQTEISGAAASMSAATKGGGDSAGGEAAPATAAPEAPAAAAAAPPAATADPAPAAAPPAAAPDSAPAADSPPAAAGDTAADDEPPASPPA